LLESKTGYSCVDFQPVCYGRNILVFTKTLMFTRSLFFLKNLVICALFIPYGRTKLKIWRETDVDHVGTVPASLMTFAAVQAVKPNLIINAGTAGGFKVSLDIPMSQCC
jgi:hypothetical protein